MVRWYKLARIFLWTSVFCSCLLMFLAIYSPETESRSEVLLSQKKLPKKQVLKNQLPEKQSTYYTKVTVEAHPRYRLPYDQTIQGKAFPFTDAHLRHFRLDAVRTLTQVPFDISDRLVLVTAASHGFYTGARAVIAGTQLHYPNHTLLVYDLGGRQDLENLVYSQLKGRPCEVQFRTFNFTKYPKHVESLKTYAWKFLIIKEVLETHDGLFWLDSSIYLRKPLPRSLNVQFHTSPVKLMAYSGHSNYAVTHPDMYTFLPTDKEKQKKTLQYEANSMLIVNTKAAFESVLKWVYLCSLHRDCIAPKGSSTGCTFNGDPLTKYHGACHRFDQAAVNLLLANNMDFDYSRYVFNNGDYRIFTVKRGQRMTHAIKTCVGSLAERIVRGGFSTIFSHQWVPSWTKRWGISPKLF